MPQKPDRWWRNPEGLKVCGKYRNLGIYNSVFFERRGWKNKYHNFCLRKGCIDLLNMLWKKKSFFCGVNLLKVPCLSNETPENKSWWIALVVLISWQTTGSLRQNWRKLQRCSVTVCTLRRELNLINRALSDVLVQQEDVIYYHLHPQLSVT